MIILLVYGSFRLGNMCTAVLRLAFVFDYLDCLLMYSIILIAPSIILIAPFKLKIGF